MLQLFTDNIEDMYNCLPKIKALFSPKHRRRLVCLAAFLMICAEISAQDATITNPSDTTGWGDSDTVSFTTSATITFPASSTITIENLIINAGDNDVTLDLNGSTLKLVRRSDWRSGRLKLGNDNAGHLIIKNGTFIADEFDTNDDLHNYLELNNANVTINQNLFVNGTGQTDITGEGTSSFIIPASYFTDYGDSNVLVFPGALQPTTATNSGGNIYTITTSGTPAPGATVTINISCKDSSSNPVDFSNITYKATITGDETYVIQETNATTDATTLNNTPASSTMQITLKIPSSVANTHGISLALYEGDSTSTLLATPVFYTQQYNETTWSGTSDTDWNKASNWNHGVPAAGMSVSIPAACLNWPLISANTNNMDSLTVEENAQLSLTDGTLSATTVTNNGTVTISGGTINGTTGNGSSDDSLIIYAGSNSSPIWGDSYQNLEIAAGTSINIGTATIAGRVINKGILNISSSFTADSFSGNGTINLNGATTSLTTTNNSATTNNLVLNNTNASLKGSFEFAAFTATDASMSGKTITLDDSVTTTIKASTLSLKGAAGSSLQLAGAGTFDTSALDTEYLSIGPDVELATYTGDISEKNCEPSDGNSQTDWLKVISNGWKIRDLSSFIYTWLGTSSDWNTASNWDTGYVPPTNSRIIIPVVSASKVYPVLPDTADFPGGTLSIASGASVQLGAKNLELSGTSTPSADILTNNGTIIYTAAGRITDGTDVINDSDAVHAGKVQYASGGSGTITTCTGSFEYYDLEVLGGGWNFDGSYKIKNKLTTGTGVDGVTENCTVSGESTIQAATFDFKGPVNFTADLTLAPYDATATFTIPSNLHEKVNTTNKKWLHLGTDTTPENIIFASPADFSYKLNLHSTATVNAEIKLRNSITATQNITGTGSLVFTGTENQTFKTNDKQFASIIENKASGNLTIEGTPTITSFTTENTAQGNIIFSDGAAITNDFIQYDGRTTVKGTITATNFSAKNLLVSADATITTAGGTQSYQNIDGIAETENLVLNATTVSLAGNIGSSKKVANLTVNAGLTVSTDADISSTTSINFAENIDATGNKLTFDSSAIKTTKSTASTITASEVVFNSNTSLSATLASSGINFDTPKISGSGATLTNTTSLTFAAEITEEPAIVNNGAISCNGAATFSGAYSGTGSLSLSGANTTFEKDVDLSGTTFSPSTGNVILSGTNTPGTAQTLKTKADGTTTFNNLTIKGNLAITESNIINNLKAENLGGNKITFTAGTTLTVSGKLTLKGSSDSSRLSLVSSSEGSPWKIKCTGTNNHEIEFADIKDSSNISENSSLPYNLFAIGSNDSGNNSNWNFPNMSYTWTGATTISGKQNDWNTATNWSPASIPGLGTNVTIAATTNHPVLTTELDIKTTISGSDYGTIVVENGATFDLAGYSLTATSITNNGRIRLTGATGQTITASMVNGTDSTVEYYDTGAASTNFAWDGDNDTAETGKQYANLILNQETSSNTQLTVSKELIINEAAELTGQLTVAGTTTISAASNKSVSLNNASNTLTGNVILGSATTATGNITLRAASLITLADNANAASLTLESPVQPGNKITTSGNQTYNSHVQINAASVLTAPDTKQITFNGEVTGSSKLMTQGDAVAHFNGNVNALNELETQAAVINCTSLSTTGNQTYNGNVSITTSGTNGASLSSDNSIIFSGPVTGTAKLKISGGGISYFNNTVQIGSLETQTTNINCTSIETTNEGQIYNGEVTLESGVVLTAPSTTIISFKNSIHGNTGSETLQINDADSQFDDTISNLTSLTTAASTIFTKNVNVGELSTQAVSINCSQITTTGNQTYNDTISLGSDLTLETGSSSAISFAENISAGEKTLTVNSPTFKSSATSTNTITADKIIFSSSVTSIQSPDAILTFAVPLIDGSSEIKLETNDSRISFTGDVSINPKVTTASGTSLTASSDSMTFNNDVNLANNTLSANNGTIILTSGSLSGNNTFNNLTLKGHVTLSGSNTITDLNIHDSVTISADNTITNITANTTTDGASGLGGKTITFGAGSVQTINGKLTLKGTSNTDNNRLLLRSTIPTTTSSTGTPWKIECSGTNEHIIEFVDIQDSNNITSSYSLFALNSIDHGNNTKWNFPGMKYKWTGADSTDPTNWNIAANWEYLSIPGKGADVTIPEITTGTIHYPKLIDALDLNDSYGSPAVSYTGKITIAANAQFDLAGKNLTVGTITNNGRVRLTGATGQTITGKMGNGTDSTVEYYDTGAETTNFAWDGDNGTNETGKQYANLILNQETSSSDTLVISEKLTIKKQAVLTGDITVTGTTSISAGSGKTVNLNNASNVFTGAVKVGDSDPSATVNAGAVTLKASSSSPITFENNANADSIEVQSAVKLQNVTTSGNQTYKGTVETISSSATIKSTGGEINFENPVNLGVQTSILTNAANKTITFGTSATINGAVELTIATAGTTTFAAAIGNSTPLSAITVTGPLNVNCTDIKSSGNQIYNDDITLNSNAAFTVSASDKKIDFNGAISGSFKLTSAGYGTANFNNNINIASLETQTAKINTASITTSSNQIYKGPVTFAADTNLTSTSDGSISFDESLDGDKLLNLTVPSTKSISFSGLIGNSTSIANPPSINIIQANTTTFAEPININTFTDDSTNHHGSITFSAGGTIRNDIFLNTDNTLSFNETMNIGAEAPWKNLTHTAGNTSITGTLNAATITLADTSTNGSINANTTQIGNITLTGNTTITTSGIQTYNGPIDDTTNGSHTLTLNSGSAQIELTNTATIGQTHEPKSFTITGPVTINCSSIKTSDSQNYNSAISSDGSIVLESATINLNAANITTAGSQDYKGAVVLVRDNTLTSDGDIHFYSTLTGNYIFTLNKANNTVFDDSVNIQSFIDTANSGNISFKNGGAITNSNGSSFLTTSLVTFGDNQSDLMLFGTTSSYADFTHTAGNTSINGNLKAANITLAETSGDSMTITNSGLFKTQDSKALSYTTSFTQNGNGNFYLGGSFSGNGPATFASCLQLYGSTAANFGSASSNISISKNLIITREATDSLTISGNINIAENLVLYKGPVTLNANLTTTKDILILGASYSENDTSTNIANEYAYTTPRHEEWSQPSYSETTLPDGSTLPETYTATLTVGTNCCLTTGKNFYANGTSLTTEGASGQWLLKLPDLTNPANGFAEAYHSVVSGCKVICSAGTTESDTEGSKARLTTLECTDAGSDDTPNTNIEFDNFEIVNAYTVRDNAIRIEFNRPIRYHASTINSLKFHNASSLPDCDFSAFYSTPDCTEESELKSDITMSYFNEDDNKTYYYFYIKASAQNNANLGAWNTDATSKTAGYSEKSSDRNGVHHDTLPCLDFPRSLKNDDGTTLSFIFTDIWGQRLKNYSLRPDPLALEPAYGSDASSYEVLDKTGPVLWTLRSGQENHNAYDSSKGQESQHSYDAHNFIEFFYSEPVNFGSADTSICDINIPAFTDDTNTEINLAENIQVTDIFGAVQEDITTSQNTMTFAGLAKITATGSSLCLHTGTEGKASKYMNALYRTDEYSLRLSIAGWTDSTVADYNGNLYKNWPGYIEEASQFTGSKASAVAETNPLVCDLSGNIQIEYPISPTEPLILSNADNLLFTPDPDIYGQWDLSSPVFAPLRFNAKLAWSDCPDTDTSEAVGNTNGSGSTLDRIEFHFFDNTPLYNSQDPAEWFTEVGWCNPGSNPTRENLKDPSYTYASDIIGGARQFDTDSKRRTSGGIRFSTKATSSAGFLYSNNASNMNPQTPFKEGIENVHTSTTSPLFTGSSSPRHPVNDPDSLYLGIGITDSNLPVESTFSFAYSDTKAYVTDLAGNRLRSKVSKTIDRTPPSFDIVLSPVGNNEMFIIFVKQIVTDSAELRLTSNEGEVIQISEDFMSLLPDCFQIISIDQDGNYSPSEEIKIDTSVPARLIPSHTSENFTTVRLALTQNVSIENVKNLYIQLKQNSNYPETSQDPFTSNKNSNVTLIQDSLGNYMGMYSAHALSDFAINSVTPLYAYASDMQYNDENVMEGLYGQGSWAVHDWNEDQQNYGTLPYGYDTQLVAESSSSDPMRLYLSEKPDAESIASQFNEDFSTKLRIWLPEVKDGIFSALTSSNNKNYVSSDSTYLNNENTGNLSFYISADTIKKWSPGDQVSFIFGLLDASGNPYRIYDSPYYDVGSGLYNLSLNNPVPLYCFRMHNPSDISTIDLWSFRLKDITNQRGGITILNNVINADLGEKTVLKVNMPTDGNLNIAVLTLDGNIITYLNKGRLSEGEHWFTWNGKNRNGTSVARGMYFIRISGSGIDETRKVMVIKD